MTVPAGHGFRPAQQEDGGLRNAPLFRDRTEAGRVLAAALRPYAGRPNLLVLALPRGGVPVGFEVARALHAPLDIMLVRKLGVPGHEELAMGAIASGGIRVVSEDVVRMLGIPERVIATVAAAEEQELERRERLYRDGRPMADVWGRTVLLVDDGLATGSTMRAAAAALKAQHLERLIVAVPIGATETCELLRHEVDDVVCARTPEPFNAVGLWYQDFSQTTDDEVRDLLRRAAELQPV
jgi:putative phosphoribosyl transferase